MARLGRPSMGDVAAGISVSLVLVPQSVAYALLAGMPPRAGLIAAGVAAIAAAPFVSTPVLQSGPTAITSLLTLGALGGLAATGSAEYVGLAALLALLVGLMRVVIGASHAGAVAYVLSVPVLAGFTLAAAIAIAASQVPHVIGVAPDTNNILLGAMSALAAPEQRSLQTIGVAAVTLLTILMSPRIHRLMPGVLLTVLGGIALASHTGFAGEVVGELPSGLPSLTVDLPWSHTTALLGPAAIIALVGFAEATAIGRSLTARPQDWDPDREFIGQGVANLACGIVGGFPAGGSLSRSALNRQAGATSAFSGAITGVAVLAVLPFSTVLEQLPHAVLAGIIIAAVVRLMSPRPVFELRRYSRQQFTVAVVTFALTLALAPNVHWALATGIALTVGAHLWRERELSVRHWRHDATLHLRPVGVLYFGSARRLEQAIAQLLDDHEELERLVVHFDAVGRTDVTGALALRDALDWAADRRIRATITGLTAPSRKIVTRVLAGTDVDVEPPRTGGSTRADEGSP